MKINLARFQFIIITALTVLFGALSSAFAATIVACVGDSITAGYGLSSPSTQSYPAQLATLLGAGYTVTNYGVSSTTVLKAGDVPYWNQSAFATSTNSGANVVVIMFGANDSKSYQWNAVNFTNNYLSMIRVYQNMPSHPQVYICYTTPVYYTNPWPADFHPDFIENTTEPAIGSVAAMAPVSIIDNNTPLINQTNMFQDGIHPTPAGAAIIAQQVYNAIKGLAPTNITTAAITSSLSPSVYGTPVTYAATISSTAGTPTGSVVFAYINTPFSTNTLSSGTASVTYAFVPINGSNTTNNLVHAQYSGQGGYIGSTHSLFQVVNSATTNGLKSVVNGQTDLTASGTYSPSGVPATTNDLAWTGGTTYSPAAFTITTTGSNVSMGTFNVLSATSMTIDNKKTSLPSSTSTLTLNGGVDAVSGSTVGDLIYLGPNATSMNIGSSPGSFGTLNMALAATGYFDISAGTLTIGSVLSGANSLTKTGAGTLTLSGTNTFGGSGKTFTLSAGTLNLNNASALGNAATTFAISGGTIDSTSSATLSAYPQSWNGDFTFGGSAALSLGSGAVTLGGNRIVTANGANALTVAGIISGANSLTKAGPGTLTLSGTNTYSGGTTISAGTVTVGSNTTVVTGGVLTAGPLGTGAITLAGGTLNLTQNPWEVANSLVASANTTNTLLGNYGLMGDLNRPTVTGSGTIILTNGIAMRNYDWSGFNGTLVQSSGDSYFEDFSSGVVNLSSAVLNVTNGRVLIFHNQISGTPTNQTMQIGTLTGNGGTLTVDSNSAPGLTIANYMVGYLNTDSTFSGTITNNYTATVSFTKVGTGKLTLSGVNTYSLGTTNSAGTLNYGSLMALGTNAVTFSGSSTLQAGLSGTFTNKLILNSGVTGTLDSQAFSATNSGIVSGSGALTKIGTGTLMLSATNTYSGNTAISAGTLALGSSGSISNTPQISIAAGATFDVSAISSYSLSSNTTLSASGTGTTVGTSAAAIKGGTTVSLGSRPITLTYDGSHPALYISPGTLSLNGNAFTVNSSSALAAGTYTIVQQASGNISSAGSYTVTGTAIGSGKTGVISVSGGNVILTIQNTPTTTTLTRTAGTSPSTYGGSLTFHAVVSPAPVDGTTITFLTNAVSIGTATTTSGAANLVISTLPYSGGSAYPVTASFAGDATYAGSSGTLPGGQQVNALAVQLAGSRNYDGTTNVAAAILSVANKVGSDTVNVASGTGGLAGKNVGAQTLNSFGTLALGNNAAGNYTLTGASGSVTIGATNLTVTAQANTKIYDGTTTSVTNAAITAGGIQTGDTAPAWTQAYDNKNSGTGKTLTPSSLVVTDGNGGANYNYTYTAANVGVINKATATATLAVNNSPVTYNGSGQAATVSITASNTPGAVANILTGGQALQTNTGIYTVTANYVPTDTNYTTLTGLSAGNFTINKAVTTFNLLTSAPTNGYHAAVFFTATNLPVGATSNVLFSANGVPFSTNTAVNGGATSLSLTNLPRGTNLITAIYSGDLNYLPNTNSLAQMVTNHPPVAGNLNFALGAGVVSLRFRVSDLLTNVTDADSDTITLVSVATSTNGVTPTVSGGLVQYYNPNSVSDRFGYTVTDGFGGTNTGYFNLVVTNAVVGQITGQFTSFSNNVANLTFHGIQNYSYVTQRSTNLTTWVDVQTNTAATNGVITVTDGFSDLGSNAPASAYYRLKY